MGQSLMDRVNFDVNPNDTRQYRTHAEWCRFLASRGSLAEHHRNCCHSNRCTNAEHRTIARKLEAAYADG